MRLTKHGHACVTVEKDGRRIVLDPGELTPEDATVGAEAVLITHEHFDHFSERRGPRPARLHLCGGGREAGRARPGGARGRRG
jgi:hypothetical protein